MNATDRLPYADQLDLVFGAPDDPMSALEVRARQLLPTEQCIVWEGDATNFQFLYVSPPAEQILGYPVERWTTEPTFWADTVLHPDDRDDAIAYCALCTGKVQDHDFEYRAITADGRTVWLHDIVRVVVGRRGLATHLRGIMIDVTSRKLNECAAGADQTAFSPSLIRTDVLHNSW